MNIAPPSVDFENSRLSVLIEHLLQHHHPYTRAALESINSLFNNELKINPNPSPEMAELRTLYLQLHDDLVPHLLKEERILFPYMLALDSESLPPPPAFGSIENPIRMMTIEHHNDGLILHKMLDLTHRFALPPGADANLGVLYAELQALVNDLFQHIYLENNVLFVKAIALEKQRRAV